MTTATLNLPELPKIERASVPPELATLHPTFKKLLATRTKAISQATQARTEYDRKTKALTEARKKDSEAFTQAALNDKPDPGRTHESTAIRELDEAHRTAEGHINAANIATREIQATINGDTGTKALETCEEKTAKALQSLSEHATVALADLAEISAYARITEILQKTRKGKTRYSTVASAPIRTAHVNWHGQGVDPVLVLRQLADGYKPLIES